MKSYYFFLIPIKDKNVEIINDSSLSGIRIEKSMFNTIKCHFDKSDEIEYFLLKGVDEASITIDFETLESVILSKSDLMTNRQDKLNLMLRSFDKTSYNKYMAIAQYPLLMINMHKRQVNIYPAKNSMDILNHLALHFYQFLNVKQCQVQIDRLDSIIQLSDKNYTPGIYQGMKFASCCVHNLLIHSTTRMFSILKHDCQRIEHDRFDNRLCQSVIHLFS